MKKYQTKQIWAHLISNDHENFRSNKHSSDSQLCSLSSWRSIIMSCVGLPILASFIEDNKFYILSGAIPNEVIMETSLELVKGSDDDVWEWNPEALSKHHKSKKSYQKKALPRPIQLQVKQTKMLTNCPHRHCTLPQPPKLQQGVCRP